MVDVTNALVKEAHVAFKNIIELGTFVNKEQWSMIWMKKIYYAKFIMIMWIIYQWERLAYFSN
jgi:hypothetical protein